MSSYFHFTIGPVQGFVAQARRTRDFWAGSFILSYLSAVAMKAVQVQKGEILFPVADERFLRCLTDPDSHRDQLPTQGGVPNRFKARVEKGFDAGQIVESLLRAWKSLATIVWKEDLSEVAADVKFSETSKIWQRQISEFWEVLWAITDKIEDSDILDRRKSWRNHLARPEPGIKCSVMDGWQELSGAPRPGDRTLTDFWRQVRKNVRGYDIQEGEHLCALAFVKRRFAWHFDDLQTDMPGGWTLRGWPIPTAVPSVAYMAAAPWLAEVIASPQVDHKSLSGFTKPARKLAKRYGEWHTDLRCLVDAEKTKGEKAHFFRSLDGAMFFESNLDNEKIHTDRELAERVKQALLELRQKVGIGPPSPFYAVLMMDGDSLGRHMSDVAKQPAISRALGEFTRSVQGIVDEHSGFLVYAGGDDVLALLPIDRALGCALTLRRDYSRCFAGTGIPSTLSGAIVYAHYKVPLTRVLGDAHELLDEVAKDGRGRDAVAVRVWTPGSRILEWSMPWEKALEAVPGEAGDGSAEQCIVISALADELANEEQDESLAESFASGFFYRLRELFELINPRTGADQDPGLSADEAVDLMAAEYVVSGIHGDHRPELETVRNRVRRLLAQCRPVTRTMRQDHPSDPDWRVSRRLEPDGGLLVRFLARKGLDL